MFTADQLLDLDGVSVRYEMVRYDLIDAYGNLIGEVHPVAASPPTVAWSTTARIRRTLNGMKLPPDEAASVDVYGDRVRPMWILSTGDEYPLGVFVWGATPTRRTTVGLELDGTLYDLSFGLDQQPRSTIALAAGEVVTDAIETIANDGGVYNVDITPSAVTLSNPLNWPVGSATTRLAILDQLCVLAGRLPFHFTADGVATVRPVPDATVDTPALLYEEGASCRIVAGTIEESDDRWQKPSVYVVDNTAATDAEVSGSYNVPASSPISFANRGYDVAAHFDLPGVASSAQAANRARELYLREPAPAQQVRFTGTPDPRHGEWDIVSYKAANHLETAWSLVCSPGGAHVHELALVAA